MTWSVVFEFVDMRYSGASFEGGWGAVSPQGKRKKEREKREKKKRKKERKKGTMNNVKLLCTYKVLFFPIFH